MHTVQHNRPQDSLPVTLLNVVTTGFNGGKASLIARESVPRQDPQTHVALVMPVHRLCAVSAGLASPWTRGTSPMFQAEQLSGALNSSKLIFVLSKQNIL